MQLSDRVTGLLLVALGALAAHGGWRLPPVPGQQIGPNVFAPVGGIGVVICGGLIALSAFAPGNYLSFGVIGHVMSATAIRSPRSCSASSWGVWWSRAW
jgi:hypothetical protein